MNKKDLPKIALGAWSWGAGSAGGDQVFGNHLFENELKPVFEAAMKSGLNLWDTVAVYREGSSERILGNFIKGIDRKDAIISTKFIPQIASDSPDAMQEIATTSGTGSEINCWGVISNHETNEKIGFGDSTLVPVLSIVDPELMTTVPAKYTAYQGFDALFHNTEFMISKGVNIMSEALALSAIEHITKYLPVAVKDGKNLEAREHVAYSSTIAGMTMQLTSTTAQHSMEHAMSAYHHSLPHG